MFDFDPRDADPRDRDDEWRDPITHSHDLDHERDLDHDHDRDLDRDRAGDRDPDDPRDVFLHGLDLPRGHDRECVLERDRTYEINGDESRTLATVGAFRVVSERDLRDPRDASVEGRDIDLRHLRDEGLIHTIPLDERDRAVVLTERGRSLLEAHRRAAIPTSVKRSTQASISIASEPMMPSSIAPTSARPSGSGTATPAFCALSSTAS